MQAWTFQSTRKAFSNFLAEIWARTTLNTSSLVFILLLLFLSPVQIFLQIWARQSTADAFNLLYAIDDYSDLPLAFEVLVPGGPLLSCFEIPPAGISFETYCDTIWNNFLAVNQSSSFQAVETTVAAAKASTVFDDYVALARPTGPPSVLAGKEGQRPNGNEKFGFGFRGDQDRPRPGGGRKQNGMGQGNNRATLTPSISQTSTINQGMLFSSGIGSLPVGYVPETIVGQPNEPTVTAPSPLPTDTSSSTVFITVVLTGDSVVNVPTQLQLTASALPIATSVDSISQSTSSLPTSISTLTEGSSLSTALPVPTGENEPQNLSQEKGKPGFGQHGSGRKKPTGVSTSRIRPLPSPNGTNKGGKNQFGTGRRPTSSGIGKGKNPFRPGAPRGKPTLKAKPNSLFPAPKKGLAAFFKSHAKRKSFGIRQAQNQTSGGSSPDADGDDDGDGADDDDDDSGDQDPNDDGYNYINATFVVPFNGKNIILQPQFDQTPTNGSSSRPPRFLGMTLTGLHSAPFGTADVTFIAVPCIRGLVWAEQSLGHTLKECSLVMGFWAWIGVVGLLAVWIQSMSLMITSFIGLLISLLLLVFQLLENQFFEREYQRAVVNGVCGGVDVIETYPNMRPDLQFGAIGIAFVSMLLTGVCARFLVPIFGAEMRAKLEELPALNRPYRLMITLKVLFELLSFIIPATAVMWLDSVFTSLPSAFSQDNELEEALFSSFAGFVIPWLMLGYEATRRSLCRTMIIFIVLTLPILAGWSAFFVVDLYRVWLVSWQFLAVLPVVAITLTTVVLVLGTIYRLDFKRGLPQLMGHCAPKDGSPVITTMQPDLERAASAGEEKVPNVGVQPKVQFDIPSTASAKSVEVEEGPSTDEGAVNDTDLWTPKRARDAAPSAWTPGRLKGIFRNSGSTMTRDRARPSRTSSVFGPGPASIASFSGSGTAPPSSYLASIKNQPTSPHYTDSSVDLSDRGPRRTPRKTGLPNAPPRPARPPRLNLLRDSVWTEESSKESDAEADPAAKQDVRTGIGPEGGLRVAGRFALGLKRLYTLPPTFQMRTSMAKQQQTVPVSNARNHHRVEPMPASVAEALPGHHILISFLATQSQISLTRLYSKPSACLALFRSVTLPDELTTRPVEPTSVSAACLDAPSSAQRLLKALERQIVMNYLWLEGPVSSNTMEVWVTREGRTSYEAAMRTLSSLQIIPAPKPGSNMLQLAPSFKKNFRLALTGGGDHMSFGVPSEKDPAGGVTVEMLDRYAANCWESILHFMVSSGTDGRASRPTKGILYLLDRSGLMAGQGAPKITSQGFQFLLTSPHAQLWTLLLQYLAITNERNIDMMEVIQFLFMLSTMQLGQEYSTEIFSTTHHSVLEDLIDYGLVYKRTPNRIYPTRLATTLTSASPITTSPSAGSSQAQTDMNTGGNSTVATAGGGFIILETNYRLYAYTENPLQIAILNLFVSLRGRFSNLVTGSITRESVRKALDNGITADQIISYLLTHAHPQMHKNNPLLPITVQDQIRLWEQEKNRVQIAEGYLWKEFTASTDYNLVLDHAKSTSSVVWENEGARMFFVTPAGHISCRDFVNQRMREGGGFA